MGWNIVSNVMLERLGSDLLHAHYKQQIEKNKQVVTIMYPKNSNTENLNLFEVYTRKCKFKG